MFVPGCNRPKTILSPTCYFFMNQKNGSWVEEFFSLPAHSRAMARGLARWQALWNRASAWPKSWQVWHQQLFQVLGERPSKLGRGDGTYKKKKKKKAQCSLDLSSLPSASFPSLFPSLPLAFPLYLVVLLVYSSKWVQRTQLIDIWNLLLGFCLIGWIIEVVSKKPLKIPILLTASHNEIVFRSDSCEHWGAQKSLFQQFEQLLAISAIFLCQIKAREKTVERIEFLANCKTHRNCL